VVRKEIKDHGSERKIDGNFKAGTNVILFDDVTTKCSSLGDASGARP
jgi:orotate phosphoribosyltransferase